MYSSVEWITRSLSFLCRLSQCKTFIVLAALLAIGSVTASSARADSNAFLWFADHKIITSVDLKTHAIAQTFAISAEPNALAFDPRDAAVWVLTQRHLLKFDGAGNELLDIDLRKLSDRTGNFRHLALNPYDGSLWIADRRSLLQLDSTGNKLAQLSISGPVRGVALDNDETLWVLTEKALLHFSAEGTRKEQVDLKPQIRARVTFRRMPLATRSG